ncbi:MAG: PIN domain-containing protein [Alphaproteobacteria bacterium]
MNYLLDTNAAIAVLRNRQRRVRERLRTVLAGRAAVAISAVVLFELHYGVARSWHQRENTERLRAFLSGQIDIVLFEAADAEIAGVLRARLEAGGTPIGPYDLLIAAQGLRTGMTVVTANVGEFARVPDLRIEDWSIPEA